MRHACGVPLTSAGRVLAASGRTCETDKPAKGSIQPLPETLGACGGNPLGLTRARVAGWWWQLLIKSKLNQCYRHGETWNGNCASSAAELSLLPARCWVPIDPFTESGTVIATASRFPATQLTVCLAPCSSRLCCPARSCSPGTETGSGSMPGTAALLQVRRPEATAHS